jgi:hypothetical protein
MKKINKQRQLSLPQNNPKGDMENNQNNRNMPEDYAPSLTEGRYDKSEALLLAPSEKLSEEWINAIRKMNAGRPPFKTYSKRVREMFNLEKPTINTDTCYFLAGFIEGEGSISISAKKNPNAKFGVELDPVFNITQHVQGVKHLYLALEMFQTGRIRFKAGSTATLVFIIEPRLSLQEQVCPFYEKYIIPFSCIAKQNKFQSFKKMLHLFDEKAHLDRNRFVNELLPIWHSMRIQLGNKKRDITFNSLEEAQEYVSNYTKI